MKSGSRRKYSVVILKKKGQKIKRSLFSLRLESAEEKLSEQRFKVHFVYFYRRESLFEMEIYQLVLCY